jgi:hypothetical protein
MYEEMIVSLRDSEDLQILLPLSDYKETEVYQFYTTKLIWSSKYFLFSFSFQL